MAAVSEATIQKLIEGFKEIPTGNIADAMDSLGLLGGVAAGLHPIDRNQPHMVGRAVTVLQGPRRPGAGTDHLTRHSKVLDETARPGDVMVISVGGRTDVCTWGGLLSLRAKRKGLAGVVIDGAARDQNDMIASGLPAFVRGFTPQSSHITLDTLAVNQPINCGGVQVRPGDIVVADDDGVVVVPRAIAEEVLQDAMAIDEVEARMTAELRQGHPFMEVFRKHARI